MVQSEIVGYLRESYERPLVPPSWRRHSALKERDDPDAPVGSRLRRWKGRRSDVAWLADALVRVDLAVRICEQWLTYLVPVRLTSSSR